METVTEVKVERPWDRRICTLPKILPETSGEGFLVHKRYSVTSNEHPSWNGSSVVKLFIK